MSNGSLLLQAIDLVCSANFASLSQLQIPSASLPLNLILRVLLTYTPPGTQPESYIPFLQTLQVSNTHGASDADTTLPALKGSVTAKERKRIQDIRLLTLAYPHAPFSLESKDLLTNFLLHQAHRIEEDTGSLDLVRRLLEPFVDHDIVLRRWMVGVLLPLLRKSYEYYPQDEQVELKVFETMGVREGVEVLAPGLRRREGMKGQRREEMGNVARDLRGLVGPWVVGEAGRKRRRLSMPENGERRLSVQEGKETTAWAYVNDLMVDATPLDFLPVAKTFIAWNGAADVNYGPWDDNAELLDGTGDQDAQIQYAQAGLAAIYASRDTSEEAIEASKGVLKQVCNLCQLLVPTDASDETIPPEYLESISQADMFHNAILHHHNPLTRPSSPATGLANLIITTASSLLNFEVRKSFKEVLELLLFRTVADQKEVLAKALRSLKVGTIRDEDWIAVRGQLLKLRDHEETENCRQTVGKGVLGKIAIEDFELQVLHAMLDAGNTRIACQLYCEGDPLVATEAVESAAVAAAYAAYDAATNGNRQRGSLKKASEIVRAIRTHFPKSEHLSEVESLLAATHSMSFYSLKSAQNAALKPVDIRVQKGPLSLIEKILQQNPRSYTHLDDLMEIGQNLVLGGIGKGDTRADSSLEEPASMEHQKVTTRRQIMRMAIEAALAEDDFDTAYSYIVTRLSTEMQSTAETDSIKPVYDDISWRAAYAAGRYPTSTSGASALRHIEQRMELLSQALLLAPPAALADLLQVWQDCEQELNELLDQDAAEEILADEMRRQAIPGAFGMDPHPAVQTRQQLARSNLKGEAPMGLFDAAREVGAALSKSTFPLKGTPRGGTQIGGSHGGEEEMESSGADGGRVRKRDMVSNMVTGGLVSGIGWVIGAPPAKE